MWLSWAAWQRACQWWCSQYTDPKCSLLQGHGSWLNNCKQLITVSTSGYDFAGAQHEALFPALCQQQRDTSYVCLECIYAHWATRAAATGPVLSIALIIDKRLAPRGASSAVLCLIQCDSGLSSESPEHGSISWRSSMAHWPISWQHTALAYLLIHLVTSKCCKALQQC